MTADDLRKKGWRLAVCNDYWQHGTRHVFYLFTRIGGRCIKGEGRTDRIALAQCAEADREMQREDLRRIHHAQIVAATRAYVNSDDGHERRRAFQLLHESIEAYTQGMKE